MEDLRLDSNRSTVVIFKREEQWLHSRTSKVKGRKETKVVQTLRPSENIEEHASVLIMLQQGLLKRRVKWQWTLPT